MLAVDLVLLDNVDTDGLEGAEADVQSDFRDLDAAGADAVEDLGSEMQSCGGSCNRAERLGVNRLVLFAIKRRVGTIDVRWKGNVSDALEDAEEISDRIETQMAFAECGTIDDFGYEVMRLGRSIAAEVNMFADAELAAGMDEGLPEIWFRCELARK